MDLTLDPMVNLLAMVNERTSVPVTEADLIEVGKPEPFAGTYANTKLSFRTSLDFSHAGWGYLHYRRIPLSDLEARQVGTTVFDFEGMDMYFWHLGQQERLYMTEADIRLDEPYDPLNWPLEYAASFKASPESLMFTGSGKLIIRTHWRFEEPEVIEGQNERLRTLIHTSLPQSLKF